MLRGQSRLSAPLGLFILALTLPAARGQADPIPYQVQPIAGVGTHFMIDRHERPIGEPQDVYLKIDGLDDRGQLLFRLRDDIGSALVLYDQGHFTPIAPPPGDSWPAYLAVTDGSVNQQGEVAFSARGGSEYQWLGTFLWDPQTQQSAPVVPPGLRPVASRSLVLGGLADDGPALLNNRGEIAFTAPLADLAGNSVASGVFFRDRDGQVTPVAITGDALPGIGTIHYVVATSLNDSGVVAFLAGANQYAWSAFTWANGKVTPVALVEQPLPGGGAISSVYGAWVNSVNGSVLVDAQPDHGGFHTDGLYLVEDSRITSVAVPGSGLPSGGTYMGSLPLHSGLTVSFPDAGGRSVFVAVIDEGGREQMAAYRVDAGGQLARLLQDGDTTAGGETILVRYSSLYADFAIDGAAVNGKGQLALPLATGTASQISTGLVPGLITLLTPTGP